MTDRPLNPNRRIFCREYATNGHNATQAYKTAYLNCKSGQRVNGCKLLTKYNIKQEIARLETEIRVEHVADRKERQEFWTDTMKTAPNMNDRLRASELLGKSQADFVDITLAIPDLPADITVDEADLFRSMAKEAINLRIA